MPSLCIKNLTKRYGENVVLNDLSLELENAEVWALVAPNGTGKTTLLDCITNLNSYQSGQITVNGLSLIHIWNYISGWRNSSWTKFTKSNV